MPSIIGYVDEWQEEKVEELVDDKEEYEDKQALVEFAVEYMLNNKHNEHRDD